MFNVISQGLFDDSTVSFLLGFVVVFIIGFAIKGYMSKKKQ
jgi:cell division protein FtsX